MHLKPLVIAAVLLLTALQASASPAPSYQQGAKLIGTGAVGNAEQGLSLALSADGNTAVEGGSSDNSALGAAWVFARSGGLWSQQGAKLVGTGAVGGARQGSAVGLSADGNTAVVAGYGDNSGVGAAWAYTRSAGVWSQQGAKLVGAGAVGASNQGYSVALSADGNTAIVGGYADNANVGAAWVYTRSAGVWSQQGGKLLGTGAVGTAHQGSSVALSADGNTAVVGGYGDNGGVGAVWVYTRSGGVWSQQGVKLVGTGAVGGADQGLSVALSADGNTAVVGGFFDNGQAGAVWVYTRSGGVWSQQGAKLVGAGAVGAAGQGYSVALSADGNTAVECGPADNSYAGAAWVYTRSGGVWSQQGAKRVGTGAVGAAQQGLSVALSADGLTDVVGAFLDNNGVGAAWVYIDPAPTIVSTRDVPNDQGGKVNIRWTASILDNEPGDPMDAYWIWRQVPAQMAQLAVASGARLVSDGAAPESPEGRVFRVTRDATQVYYWEGVGIQSADGYPGYSFTASTTADSIQGSNPYTLFMVEAKQNSTGARWPSDPESAYSVDNVPPAEPAPFLGSYALGTTRLHWKENVEPDLGHYNLYRGASSGFVPGPANRIASLPDTSYADATPGGHYYKLSAVDVHGNESAFNLLTPQQIGAAPDGSATGLWLGHAAPNPADGNCVARYSLANSGPADLSVFDTRGGLVRRLVRGVQSAGEAQVTWDGRNDRGTGVAGGIYFLRLTAGSGSLTQRVVWIR